MYCENIIEHATEWLRKQIPNVHYGTVIVSFTIHDGEIRRVSKTIEVKDQL
jgi:hypothetical protein